MTFASNYVEKLNQRIRYRKVVSIPKVKHSQKIYEVGILKFNFLVLKTGVPSEIIPF